ncbi:hypothetical protein JCM8097_004637 [Rhodosporidiobolus ruineniae]
MSDSLQALLDRAIARGAAPGLVACAFDRNGTFASAASGTSSIETGSAMSINTTIWLASTSKTLVSLAALVLVERDGFDLDSHEELVKVVPELGKGYPGSRVWELFDGKDENGEWRFKQAQKGITLRHLLTHTSGFAYDFVAEETAWLAQQAEQAGMPFEPGSIRSYNIPRLFEAGESWCYGCSPGYIAIFIMRKTGVPLRQALWELILKPLGVAPDTLDIFVTPRMELNRADIAMRNSTSFLTPKPFPFTMPNCENETPEGYIPFADGPFSGTALAFADVLRSFLNGSAPGSNGEKPLLSPKMWRTATQDNIGLRGMSIPQGPMFKSFVPQKINSVERLATPKNKGVNDSLGWTPLQTLHHRNEVSALSLQCP